MDKERTSNACKAINIELKIDQRDIGCAARWIRASGIVEIFTEHIHDGVRSGAGIRAICKCCALHQNVCAPVICAGKSM